MSRRLTYVPYTQELIFKLYNDIHSGDLSSIQECLLSKEKQSQSIILCDLIRKCIIENDISTLKLLLDNNLCPILFLVESLKADNLLCILVALDYGAKLDHCVYHFASGIRNGGKHIQEILTYINFDVSEHLLNNCLITAIEEHHIGLIKFFIECGAKCSGKSLDYNWEYYFEDYIENLTLLMDENIINISKDISKLFELATSIDKDKGINLVENLFDRGLEHSDITSDILDIIINNQTPYILEILMSHGYRPTVTDINESFGPLRDFYRVLLSNGISLD
jgi:hypothetical protein